ncbi:FBF1 factor, partial [Polypterus senegalus]
MEALPGHVKVHYNWELVSLQHPLAVPSDPSRAVLMDYISLYVLLAFHWALKSICHLACWGSKKPPVTSSLFSGLSIYPFLSFLLGLIPFSSLACQEPPIWVRNHPHFWLGCPFQPMWHLHIYLKSISEAKPSSDEIGLSSMWPRAVADEDFFSKLAEEAANEEDMDDLDAELFGTKKKPSSAPGLSAPGNNGRGKLRESLPADSKTSGPAASVTNGQNVSGSLLTLVLSIYLTSVFHYTVDSDNEERKSSSAPAGTDRSKKSALDAPVSLAPAPKKQDDVLFDDDGDDFMDALGFGDFPKRSNTLQEKKTEVSVASTPSARSSLDEILGRGTAPRLLERPLTGDRKGAQHERISPAGDEIVEDNFILNANQPATTEGRGTRRPLVRFSEEDLNGSSLERKSKSAPSVTSSSARSNKPAADWLGLKDEEPVDELLEVDSVAPRPVPSSSSQTGSRPPSGTKSANTPSSPQLRPKSEATKEEEVDWLSRVLSEKKQQSTEKISEKSLEVDSQETSHDGPMDTFVSKPATPPLGRRRSPYTERIPEELPFKSKDATGRMMGELEKQLEDREMELLAGKQAFQTRILELECQVRKLELERNQAQSLVESLQQRQQQDLELIEGTHRTRVKMLEDSFQQREARLSQENEDLLDRIGSLTRNREQDRADLQAQFQRRIAEVQQERDKEVERLRDLQRRSVLEMKADYENQLQHLKWLKEQEIDAVTSASSQTRSLAGVIEQMEAFTRKLGDLSLRVESTHEQTAQGLELGARHREEQLRVLQEQLSQQQRDMEEERSRLQAIISKMENRLTEQQRLLEKVGWGHKTWSRQQAESKGMRKAKICFPQERWRLAGEQAKVESLQTSIQEERKLLTQQLAMEREELEKAKVSGLKNCKWVDVMSHNEQTACSFLQSSFLEEQQVALLRCSEERRQLATEWAEYHKRDRIQKERATQQVSQEQERDAHREESVIAMAKEQAELKVKAGELKVREETLHREREALEKEKQELQREKERVNGGALQVRQRAEEIESFSKLASEKYAEGEHALHEARRVASEHQARLARIHHQMERLRQQEQHLHQERLKIAEQRREAQWLRKEIPVSTPAALNPPAFTSCRYGLLPQVCRALVLVNPQGGSGQAVSIFHNQVKKMLMEADIQYTLLVTDKQNHARDLMRTAELSQWDIVVILSGDGLIFEVINGLMERADWCDAIQKPLAILPGGSGNALASSINNYSRFPPVTGNHLLLNCTFLLCKGLISPMDLMSVTTASGHRLFSFLSVSWGFVSDVDIESERLRPIGGARFTLGTLWRLASLRVYQGKVAYLSLEAKTDSSPNSQQFTTGTNGPKDTLLVPLDQPVPSHWTLVEDEELVLVLAACQTHLGEDFICAPAALLSDGIIHLIVVKAGISRSALLSLFLAMEKGTHLQVQSPHVLYIQTRAFRLVPHSTKGYMTVDGERVECGPIQAQVHHQLGRVISG